MKVISNYYITWSKGGRDRRKKGVIPSQGKFDEMANKKKKKLGAKARFSREEYQQKRGLERRDGTRGKQRTGESKKGGGGREGWDHLDKGKYGGGGKAMGDQKRRRTK